MHCTSRNTHGSGIECGIFALGCAIATLGACHNDSATSGVAPSDASRALDAAPAVATKPAPLSDADITQAIERHFHEEPLLRKEHVHVAVAQGVVTVSGTVSNMLASQRAASDIETLRGVRSVIDQITVTPVKRTDEQIDHDVKGAFEHDAATHALAIAVSVKDGRVRLTGACDSWQQRDLFVDLASAVPGVTSLDDAIVVHYTTKRTADEVAGDVRSRIANDVWLDGNTLIAKVTGDEVHLSGLVGSVGQRSRARTDALVAGVDKVDSSGVTVDWLAVDDQRRVTDYPVRSDAEITQAIKDAFRYDPRLKTLVPLVVVHDGVAALTGTVETVRARSAAHDDAKNTVGVWSVNDEVAVQAAGKPGDADIERAVKQTLAEDLMLVDPASIKVTVSKGKVVLVGTASSGTERLDAVVAAETVPGVLEIQDNITVKLAPEEIRDNIEKRLYWDPMVERNAVTVSVSPDGLATLAGTVAAWGEVRAATEDALKGGAARVTNVVKLRNQPTFVVRGVEQLSPHLWTHPSQ